MTGETRRLLLVQLYHLGDVALCTPAVRAARHALPEARIDFLTGTLGTNVLSTNSHIDDILTWKPGGRPFWRLVRELRRRRYDTVVDFQSHPRTAPIVFASGAPRRIGFRKRGPRNQLYTTLASRQPRSVYMARQKLALLRLLGVEIGPQTDVTLDIPVNDAEREWAGALWKEHGLAGASPVVAISAVSRDPQKQWGVDRWSKVADALVELGAKVLLTKGPGERAQVEEVVRRMHHQAIWEYGTTTIPQLAALYQRCTIWLGNDGGPKHVAASTGTPTMTVSRWPLGVEWTDPDPVRADVFLEAPPVAGCETGCQGRSRYPCMCGVTPSDVVRTARDLLGEQCV